MGWRNESVCALGKLGDALADLSGELNGSTDGRAYPAPRFVALHAVRAAREAFEAAGPAVQEDSELYEKLAPAVADIFVRLVDLLDALDALINGRAEQLAGKLRELAQRRAPEIVEARDMAPAEGGPLGKHVVTVSRQPDGAQLHLAPEACAVDVHDSRILVCWPPASARLVAHKLLEAAAAPPATPQGDPN